MAYAYYIPIFFEIEDEWGDKCKEKGILLLV